MDLTRVEHLQHLARSHLLDVDLQAGAAAAAHQRVGQQRLDHRVEPGDADDRPLTGGEFPQPRFRLVDLPQDVLRMSQQHAPRIREDHAVVTAIEQSGADAVLESGQLL